jgi:hypothetical protein
MADAPPTSLDHLLVLEEHLREPQPMCLVLVAVGPGDGQAPADLADAVEDRLRGTQRDYDELVSLPDGRFAIVLPTLAGTDELGRRVDELYELLSVRYEGLDEPVCSLGAAIRHPGEEPADFLRRLGDAHGTAARRQRGGAVLV